VFWRNILPPSSIYHEDRGNVFPQNVGTHLPYHMMSLLKRQQYELLCSLKVENLLTRQVTINFSRKTQHNGTNGKSNGTAGVNKVFSRRNLKGRLVFEPGLANGTHMLAINELVYVFWKSSSTTKQIP
jgi:hypothetical protein